MSDLVSHFFVPPQSGFSVAESNCVVCGLINKHSLYQDSSSVKVAGEHKAFLPSHSHTTHRLFGWSVLDLL